MRRFRRLINTNLSLRFIYVFGIFIALSLATSIALLVWHLFTPIYSDYSADQLNRTCPPNPCVSITMTSSSSIRNTTTSSISDTSMNTRQTSGSVFSSSSTMLITDRKRTYRESCEQLYDCYIDYGLLCEYGWNETKSCLCEGSHYWSSQRNRCIRKSEINDSCEVDYQCHREIGLVCDTPPGASTKTCICAASIYWAKDSNCGRVIPSFGYILQCLKIGQTTIRRIIDCIDENYATTCFVLDNNNIYHRVTIRSIMANELSFDWFLIDTRALLELPQLSCAFNNDTTYCFGLSTQDSQHSLKLAQFTRQGFHSIENIGGANRGVAFGLTNINNVSIYVRNAQNTLYRRMIIDDEILSAHDIAQTVSGDPTCYVQELSTGRQVYCYARNSAYSLTEYIELSANVWRTTELGNATDRIRDETAPVCSYVGLVHRYCFAVFENGRIYRIIFRSVAWSTWQSIGGENQQQPLRFRAQPIFLTSKPLNESSSNQTCYLIAIDTNNYLQLSINLNCAMTDAFTAWTPMAINMKFQQFNKTFRLRDGRTGVLGTDEQNRPYYTVLDPNTNRFTIPRPALTVKSEQFRP